MVATHTLDGEAGPGWDRLRSDSGAANLQRNEKPPAALLWSPPPYAAPSVGNPPDGSAHARIRPLTKDIEQARAAAEAKFKKAEAQRAEGQKARAEYDAAQIAERKKTARLREARLAREAAENAAPPPAPAPARASRRQKQPA